LPNKKRSKLDSTQRSQREKRALSKEADEIESEEEQGKEEFVRENP